MRPHLEVSLPTSQLHGREQFHGMSAPTRRFRDPTGRADRLQLRLLPALGSHSPQTRKQKPLETPPELSARHSSDQLCPPGRRHPQVQPLTRIMSRLTSTSSAGPASANRCFRRSQAARPIMAALSVQNSGLGQQRAPAVSHAIVNYRPHPPPRIGEKHRSYARPSQAFAPGHPPRLPGKRR